MPNDDIQSKLLDVGKKVGDAAISKPGLATICGGGIGAYIGSSIGIVALGTGIAGTLPVAVVGAGVGYLATKAWQNRKKE